MLLVLSIISLVVGIFGLTIAGNMGSSNKENSVYVISIPSFMFGVIVTVVGLIAYCSSVATVADLEAYHDVGMANHIMTIQNTENAVIKTTEMVSNITVSIPLDNFSQSTNWSNRLKEFRDETADYNNKLQRLNKYNSNWMLNTMFANPPERLKLINIKESN